MKLLTKYVYASSFDNFLISMISSYQRFTSSAAGLIANVLPELGPVAQIASTFRDIPSSGNSRHIKLNPESNG